MKKFSKRLFAGLLVAALIFTSMYMAPAGTYVQAEEKTVDYEIYPKPHEISYQEGEHEISSQVNVVFEEGIDDATKNRMKEVLDSKDKVYHITEEKAEGQTNIFVGVNGSKDYVDEYVKANYEVDAALFEHFGSYFMASNKNEICILGKDTDGAFYGITSLKHIFNQMDGSVIRNFTMKDYADTNIRGFIEGYYGIPWSNQDRMSLMEFGGEFKMTSYVFAPKDDPYHTRKWRELYPAEELEKIKEMVAVGNASKCKFVWTAHPFMGGFNTGDVNGEIAALLRKFDQLYEAGVRQFGVLGDDVGNLNRQVVIQVMTAVSNWAKEKGDVYDSVFCPAGYNDAWAGNYSELNDYDAGFPDDVKIFWTGQAVCQPIEQRTLNNFRRKNLAEGQEDRRAPLFWLNWPVNDINMSRLLMGKGSLLHTDINIDDLAGAVTNPMQDAEASKVALFAVADYTWNVANFDDDKSWVDSFKYIDKDAAEPLYTLAKHMSDPSPNNHGLVLGESEELKPLLDEFLASYEASVFDAEKAAALIQEFEVIKKACDDFHVLSKNEKLKEEILPFSNALKDLVDACILLINTADAVEADDADAVWVNYSNALAKLAASKNHDRITIGGTAKAIPASKRIRPFASKLNELVSVPVNSIIDETQVITSLITNRTDTSDGALDKLIDNNEGTEVIWKNPNSAAEGTYIGLAYNNAIALHDVTFKMGQSGNPRDTFQSAKIQYTEDGEAWIDIEGTEYTDRRGLVTAEGLDLKVKGVRLIATDYTGNMWLGCKDIVVNKEEQAGPEEPDELNKTIIRSGHWTIYSGSETNLTDGNDDTGIWYDTGAADDTVVGDFIGMNLGSVVKVGKVKFVVGQDGGDKWAKYHLEYSTDNENWTTVKAYEGNSSGKDIVEEDLNGAEAQYVRLVNDEYKKCWVKFGEVSVEQDTSLGTSKYTYTNVKELETLKAVFAPERTAFKSKDDITLKSGEYVGLKLDRIKDITNIDTDSVEGLTLQTSKNAVVWSDVTGEKYEDARYIRLMNNGKEDVTFDLTTFAVESYEIAPISVADKNVNFYSGGDGLNAFDQNRTTEVIFYHSQRAGDQVTYDLGQTIDLDSLSLVSKDSAGDFPRHAKISISEDGETWEDVMFIGNQDSANEGEAEGEDNIMDVLPIHDVSSNLKTVEGLNAKARYIKFEITRDKIGPDKWTRYTEIELNGGDMFLPSENNPTIVTDAEESTGNIKTNMIDGEVSTTFKPVGDKAGSFTYYISEHTEIGSFKILQSPSVTSGAKVSAEVVKGTEVMNVALGTLDKSFNVFDTNAYDHVLEITVEWAEGSVPEVHEIITGKKTAAKEGYRVTVDGTVLKDNCTYNEQITLPAPEVPEGKVFAGWELNGEIVSLEKEYKFYVAGDMDFKAVFADEAKEVEPKAMITNVIAEKRAAENKYDVKFVGQLAIPEGYDIVNAGLVWSSKEETLLDLNSELKPTYIKAISDTNQFSVTIKGMPAGRFLRGKIFATVKNTETGETEVIYSVEKRADTK